METFNALFKGIIASVGAKSVNWAKARLTKNELKKSFESVGYASEFYPALELREAGSWFAFALAGGIAIAKARGLDPAIFQRWVDTRAAKTYEPTKKDEEDSAFDVDAFTAAMIAPAPATTTPAADPAATPATAETPAA